MILGDKNLGMFIWPVFQIADLCWTQQRPSQSSSKFLAPLGYPDPSPPLAPRISLQMTGDLGGGFCWALIFVWFWIFGGSKGEIFWWVFGWLVGLALFFKHSDSIFPFFIIYLLNMPLSHQVCSY